jgi:hypothetical protein
LFLRFLNFDVWGEGRLTTARQTSWAFLAGKKHQVFSPAAADKTLHALKLFLKPGK